VEEVLRKKEISQKDIEELRNASCTWKEQTMRRASKVLAELEATLKQGQKTQTLLQRTAISP
jgi:adenylate cyclase class IV